MTFFTFSLEKLCHVLILLLHPPVDLADLVVEPVQDLVVLVQLVVEAGGQELESGEPLTHLVQVPVQNVVHGSADVLFDTSASSQAWK